MKFLHGGVNSDPSLFSLHQHDDTILFSAMFLARKIKCCSLNVPYFISMHKNRWYSSWGVCLQPLMICVVLHVRVPVFDLTHYRSVYQCYFCVGLWGLNKEHQQQNNDSNWQITWRAWTMPDLMSITLPLWTTDSGSLFKNLSSGTLGPGSTDVVFFSRSSLVQCASAT